MKKFTAFRKNLIAFCVALGVLVALCALSACTLTPTDGHKCEAVCQVCGGCLNGGCTDEVCANKCSCEEPLPNRYTVSYSASAGGRIDGQFIQTVTEGENGTAVTAIPNEGYVFVGWSDGVKTATRTEQGVTSNVEVTVRFEKISYTVNYLTEGNGTLQGETVQTVKYKENGTAVTAIPNEGYVFVGWSDGVKTATRTEQGVTSNIEVTARFEKISYTINYLTDGNGMLQGETVQTVKYKENGTAVTAIPNEGCIFVGWSDGVETATRTEQAVTSNKEVTARFEKKTYQVTYQTNSHLHGLVQDVNAVYPDVSQPTISLSYSVAHGDSAPVIRVCPKLNKSNESFVFLHWSDGETAEQRQDVITSDITITAYFGYTIEYKADGRGKIEGKTEQKLLPDETGEGVKAIPDNGYVFCGWSDLSRETQRNGDSIVEQTQQSYAVWEYVAYFEPIQKTFRYDYGIAGGNPLKTEITLDRKEIQSAEFVVPEYEGYVFRGWYADSEYRVRITTEVGRYMYGYAAFSLETDTLYAKWEKEGEATDPHKILLVFVDEIDANLRSDDKELNIYIDVYDKMCSLDYQMSKWINETIGKLLSEWFEGEVLIEVDAYFTTKVIGDDSFPVKGSNELFATEISEISDIIYQYHNTITYLKYGGKNENNVLLNWSGLADIKNACVQMENYWNIHPVGYLMLQKYMEGCKNGEVDIEQTTLHTSLHELAHTAEMNYELGYDLHTANDYAINKYGGITMLNTIKPYLLGEFEMYGNMCGVPMKYWKHQELIHIEYVTRSINGRKVGSIFAIEDGSEPSKGVGRNLQYGSDFSVEALPDEGYRFVGWSDGITTALRHDKNIIAYYRVEAIFEII